jgi:hypothetical protein
MYAKFQGQKIHQKNVIQNLPTLVVIHCCQLWQPPKDWINFFLPWNSWKKNFFMLITYDKNFKARRLIQKIYWQSTNMCSCGKQWGKLCYQLWHPPYGWEIVYLPWNFWYNMLFMTKSFMPNFKVKKSIQRKLFTIYQCV